MFRVISGGQQGADRVGLEVAKLLGFQTGGYAPKGYRTLKGNDLSLKTEFGLKETKSSSYIERSKLNVDESDATLLFRSYKSNGTEKTLGYCITGRWCMPRHSMVPTNPYRPYFIVNLALKGEKEKQVLLELAQEFIEKNVKTTLNIAGHSVFVGDWDAKLREFLVPLLKRFTVDTSSSSSGASSSSSSNENEDE